MNRKVKICFALLCIILFTTMLSSNTFPYAAKRILLIVMDGARYDYCTPETMPNLYAFMDKALIFSNAYAPSCWTLPSHASLFTGLYPQQHGAFRFPYHPTNDVTLDSKRRLEEPIDVDTIAVPQEAVTIADILHAAGYQTLGVFGNPCYGYPIFNLQKGFDTWVNVVEKKLKAAGVTYRGFYSFDYSVGGAFYSVMPSASEVASEVTAVLEAADPARPIFLFINFEDPMGTPFYFPPEQRGEIRSNYKPYLNGSMKKIDDVLLPIMSFFKDGLIIVTSDHGQGDGGNYAAAEHGTSLFPDQTKIPLFIHNLTQKKLKPETPIDLTHVMDIILKATKLDHPGKKNVFYTDTSAALSHLDALPEVPVGSKASFGIFSDQAMILLTRRTAGFDKHFRKQRGIEKNISELLEIEDDLSERIVPFMNLERVFPKTGKHEKLDEDNIEMLKGLGYIE